MSVIRACLADNCHRILAMSVVQGNLADNYHHILTMSVIGANLADNYHHILTMSTISSIFEIERFGVNWFIDWCLTAFKEHLTISWFVENIGNLPLNTI